MSVERNQRLRDAAKSAAVAAIVLAGAFLLVRDVATHVGASNMIGSHVREKRAAFRPPAGVDALAGLVAAGEITGVRRIVRGGATQYVAVGEVVPGTLASGGRCYLVDHRGEIIDYSATSGDGELAGACDEPGDGMTVDAAVAETDALRSR